MKKIIILFLVFGITLNLTAQLRINLDTLNIDQLNIYKAKAIKLRNAGIVLTCAGVGIVAAGFIITGIRQRNVTDPYDSWEGLADAIPSILGTLGGAPVTIAGITSWAIGDSRKTKAEIALKKFDIKTENSMALGVGITLRF